MEAFQELDRATDIAPGSTAPLGMALPRAGERFSDEELHARFGVPTEHGIRVSRENKCIVLVHLVGIHSGYTNTDRGTDILYMGENSDREGLQDQEMSGGNLALSRSKEDGYTVLYFIKEGSVLVFRSHVEYDSHKIRKVVNGKDQLRGVIEFRLRAIRGERPVAGTAERGGAAAPPVAERAEIEEIYSPPLTYGEIAAIEDSLSDPEPRSASKEEFLDMIMDDKKLKEHIRHLDS